MSTKLTDLDEYFAPGLVLTVLGREYSVPLASAEMGLWCRRVATATGQLTEASSEADIQAAMERIEKLPQLPGGSDLSMAQHMLGDVYDQMAADKVPDAYVEYCGMTAYVWVVAGEQAATRWWKSGGRPEAPRPDNRASRRAAKKAAGSSRTTSTGEAPTTRTPASGAGTSSRKTTKAAAKASPGKRSSKSGS